MSAKQKIEIVLPKFQKTGYSPIMSPSAGARQCPTPPSPPAARLGAIEREVRRHRITERASRGWTCDGLVRRAAGDEARAVAVRGRRTAARRSAPRGFNLPATL
jgi:hypothetical protein